MSEQDRARLAARVRPARRALGLTQGELAEQTGVSRRTIGNVEAGRVVPHASVLERLDRVLGFVPGDPGYSLEIRNWIAGMVPLLERMDPETRSRVMQHSVFYAGYALAGGTSAFGIDDGPGADGVGGDGSLRDGGAR